MIDLINPSSSKVTTSVDDIGAMTCPSKSTRIWKAATCPETVIGPSLLTVKGAASGFGEEAADAVVADPCRRADGLLLGGVRCEDLQDGFYVAGGHCRHVGVALPAHLFTAGHGD